MRITGHLLVWVLAAGVSRMGGAAGAITLDADFDHGSLASWSVTTLPGTRTATVNLVGRDNFYGGGDWRWVYFRADGVQGLRPIFSIAEDFAGGPALLDSSNMVYSYDGQTWDFFDAHARSGGDWRFNNTTPFTQDSVLVAYSIPYSYGQGVAHTQQLLATSPWVQPTASGDGNGVIGFSPGGIDDLGRSIAPREIYAYRVTNPATDDPATPKRKAVFGTGMHPAETLGTYTFEGLINWLTSNDRRAAALRDVAEFYAYPTLNPDGRFAGYNRSTVENPNQDPNGRWSQTKWIGHEDIQVNGEAMIADTAATPGGVDAFIDFHSTWPSSPGDDFGFIEFEQNDNQVGWWRTLLDTLQPNLFEIDSTSPDTSSTSANFADLVLGADVDVTFETQLGTTRNLDYYRQLGKNFGLAFYSDWVGTPVSFFPGDVDGDGFVAQADLDAVLLNWGRTVFGGADDGDLNEDFLVEQGDLDAVLLHWGATAEPQFNGVIVPEPVSAAAFVTAFALVRMRRRGGVRAA